MTARVIWRDQSASARPTRAMNVRFARQNHTSSRVTQKGDISGAHDEGEQNGSNRGRRCIRQSPPLALTAATSPERHAKVGGRRGAFPTTASRRWMPSVHFRPRRAFVQAVRKPLVARAAEAAVRAVGAKRDCRLRRALLRDSAAGSLWLAVVCRAICALYWRRCSSRRHGIDLPERGARGRRVCRAALLPQRRSVSRVRSARTARRARPLSAATHGHCACALGDARPAVRGERGLAVDRLGGRGVAERTRQRRVVRDGTSLSRHFRATALLPRAAEYFPRVQRAA